MIEICVTSITVKLYKKFGLVGLRDDFLYKHINNGRLRTPRDESGWIRVA